MGKNIYAEPRSQVRLPLNPQDFLPDSQMEPNPPLDYGTGQAACYFIIGHSSAEIATVGAVSASGTHAAWKMEFLTLWKS